MRAVLGSVQRHFSLERSPRALALLVGFLAITWLSSAPILLARDDGKESEAFRLTEEECERVESLFHASKVTITPDCKVEVLYDFEEDGDLITEDWRPPVSAKKGVIRPASGGDGASEGVSGMIIADTGEWFLHARFLPEVKVDVSFLSFTGGAKKDAVCTVFAWNKLKQRIGSNLGEQGVLLVGKSVAAPVGGSAPTISYEQKSEFGFSLAEGTFSWTTRGRERGSTSSKKALRRLGPGQVGLVWAGRVSGCIRTFRVEGTLDLDWITDEDEGIAKRHREWEKKRKAVEKKGR